MRRIWLGTSLLASLAVVDGGCSSDRPDKAGAIAGFSGSAGTQQAGGASSGGGGGGGQAGESTHAGGASSAGEAGGPGSGGEAGAGAGGGQSGQAGEPGGGGEGGRVEPECSAISDDCANGSYCTPEGVCAPGCKDGASCPSGICGPLHDCEPCLADGECAEARLCGTGVCAATCTEGVPGSCAEGFSCCGTRCVDTERDIGNCGACGSACDPSEFCGTTGCLTAVASNVCKIARATAILDGQAPDDAVAADVLAAIAAQCSPPPVTSFVNQTQAPQINPATGQVVTSGGELLVFAGGPYFHEAMQFLEAQRSTPVFSAAALPQIGFYRSVDNSLILESTLDASTVSHDIVVVQVGREVLTGTPSLILYGFHQNGTRAAAWQFINVILPDLANFTDSYWVYEWTDGDADQLPDAGEFTLHGSG